MERLALAYRLRPDAKEAYVRFHRQMGQEMRDFLRRAGVRVMTIFARGDTLFLYAEVDDLERYEEMEAVDPVSQEWEALMAPLLDQPYDDEESGIFAKLEQVWRFES